MPLQPAMRFCGGFQLLQGVQVIASYTVILGAVSIFSLVTGRGEAADMPKMVAIADSVQALVHAFALIAGLKGLVGIMLRDPKRIRMLLIYHVIEVVTSCIVVALRIVGACDELRLLQQKEQLKAPRMSCESARLALLSEFVLHTSLFSYCIYIIWSAMTRMGAGEYGRTPSLFGDVGLVGLDEFNDTVGTWLTVPPHGNTTVLRDPLNVSPMMAPPFSGQPRTLAEPAELQSLQHEHFSGTPQRLE
eukprot:NODE_10668_length_1336_cov_8.930521.p1 GENE.NODE_10668_length_1336_cov_8.930521~~NODE_10668_length_1336_cov_8.930521.p1  ORF type:complete len:247 (-),score=72.51 NODE_10668_length_1336_cov_8.930521:464-1204(-)